jgi:hypothetical protein
METPILDLSYLYEISGNDPKYIYDIISLFLDNVPAQLAKLDQLIMDDAEWPVIQKQAHSLKSSVIFVKIKGLFDGFYGIEMLAKSQSGRDEMRSKLGEIKSTYAIALPLLHAEKERCASLFKD